jgi:hypothetical protein
VPARQRTRARERSPPRGYMSPVTRIPAEFRSPTLEPDASCWPFQAILRRWLSQPKVGILAALDLAAALPWNLLYLTTQNACAIIGPAKYLSKSNLVLSQPFCVQSALQSARLLMDKCQVLVQEQLGVIAAFLRPVHVTKREVIDGQVPGCVLSRTLVRSRERDHCFRVKITSFSMKQTSAPGARPASGTDLCFQKKAPHRSLRNKHPPFLPRVPGLCGEGLYRSSRCEWRHMVRSDPETGLSPCPLML